MKDIFSLILDDCLILGKVSGTSVVAELADGDEGIMLSWENMCLRGDRGEEIGLDG